MKKLNNMEIKQFADALFFSQSEAQDITDLFYNLKKANPINHWRVMLPLNNVDEYIREWENHWHRESDIEECFKYEKDAYFYAYDPEFAQKIFENIESFKEYSMKGKTQFVYQLPNNKMVAVVC
jgi:hypothetical protein